MKNLKRDNNGPHAHTQATSAELARARIIAALIPLDNPPEALTAVLRTIKEAQTI